ncbi:hypothetical protein MRX96_023775 [Rhipicephalus microplus]
MQLLDAKHVHTLESSVQTDSGYFESRREYGTSGKPGGGDVEETVTKQGTFIEGGRTLKQAIITNVYVKDFRGTTQSSENSKTHTALNSSTTRRVVEEVIVKKKDGADGHVVKRITRRPSGDEEVRVTGEVRDNVETTPEGFTSVTFSEHKSSETGGRASSEDDARARLLNREAGCTLQDVPESGTSREGTAIEGVAVLKASLVQRQKKAKVPGQKELFKVCLENHLEASIDDEKQTKKHRKNGNRKRRRNSLVKVAGALKLPQKMASDRGPSYSSSDSSKPKKVKRKDASVSKKRGADVQQKDSASAPKGSCRPTEDP